MTAVIPDIDIFTDVDMDLVPQCEHEQHHMWHAPGDPAAMRVRRLACPLCGYNNEGRAHVIMLCQSGWDNAAPPAMLMCANCGNPEYRDVYWRYLGHLS